MPVGVYIHVPFCRRKCPYCDFYSLTFDDVAADAYTEAVLRAIRTQPYGDFTADTVYFGGGTPSLLGAERIGRILNALTTTPDAEITVEANPASTLPEALTELRDCGVNRISLGVQSMQAGELRSLGRPHSPDDARRAITAAAEAGFDDISADVMLAIPGQSRSSLAATIAELADLPVNHISAYLLKIEENTPFFAQKERLALPDEDETAELYLECVGLLERQGFSQYEISNFARDGNVSRHNLRYWRCEEYLGVGPSAHSYMSGRRFFLPRDLDGFMSADEPFSLAADDGEGGSFEEQIMLRLRLSEGIDISRLRLSTESAERLLTKALELAAAGLVRVNGDNIALTPEGFLLSNSVIFALIEATDPAC